MLSQLWKARWSLLGFALAFQLVENLLFAPLMAILGRALRGRPVLDSTALVEFFLSPRGLLVLALSLTASLTLRLAGHAGLSALVLGALEGVPVQSRTAFRWLARELPRLGVLGSRILLWLGGLGLPTLGAAAWLVPPLLRRHDINYYLASRPPEFLKVAVVLGLLLLATLGVGLWQLVRWRLVVQVCVLDRVDGRAAFREAATLSRGVRRSLAARCLFVLAVQGALLLGAAGLQQLILVLTSGIGEGSPRLLAVFFLVVLVLHSGIGAWVTAVGAVAEAAVFTRFHRERRRSLGGPDPWSLLQPRLDPDGSGILRPGFRVAALGGLLAGVGVASAVLVVGALQLDGPVTVTAHRGDHHRAPENTLGSVRDAIAAGADLVEIDVQLSRDGVLVVTHDSDFSRLAGVATKVWDLTYEQIRAIPLHASGTPGSKPEFVPTLDEVLVLARDGIRLNIELKYYGDHQPRLAERVVQALQKHQMTSRVIVQCLEYEPLQELRGLAPGIPTGYLLSVNARHPSDLKVDFLAAEKGRVNGPFIQRAHRHGQRVHAWTVDDPRDMDRLIALGVDDLITNEPALARERVRAHRELTDAGRLLRRMNAWLQD